MKLMSSNSKSYQNLVTLTETGFMGRNTSVSLGDYFEKFVDAKVEEGRYKNASEVIRAGLRLFEEEETKVRALKKALEDGMTSGVVKNFDPKKHLKSLKSAKTGG